MQECLISTSNLDAGAAYERLFFVIELTSGCYSPDKSELYARVNPAKE
ncbi:hypothetical protein MICAI_230023 [Microcystis sp. T1-4]|nr:hypothetical protein MICAI_230023 [Microcystis sp. T1-4]